MSIVLDDDAKEAAPRKILAIEWPFVLCFFLHSTLPNSPHSRLFYTQRVAVAATPCGNTRRKVSIATYHSAASVAMKN